LFKAGTKERQHIDGIRANGRRPFLQLVQVEARGDDKNEVDGLKKAVRRERQASVAVS
jgi:hypothetical protein